jgi:hypothetical protein
MIYLAHPRTASISTGHALKRLGFICPQGHHDTLGYGLSIAAEKGYELDLASDGDWTIATTIRYHLDSLVSWWHYLGRKVPLDPGFVDYIIRVNRNFDYFPIEREWFGLHRHQADTLLRFERIEDDLNRWLRARGFASVPLPHDGGTLRPSGVPFKFFVDRTTADYIAGRYGDEIEELGYPDPREEVR